MTLANWSPDEIVVDSSVLIKWFRAKDEEKLTQARKLRRDYQAARIVIVVPPLLYLEILNTAASRWKWRAAQLARFAERLIDYGFRVQEPPLARVAYWAGQGLSAYDACYVALAEHRHTAVVTADAKMLAVGGAHARAL